MPLSTEADFFSARTINLKRRQNNFEIPLELQQLKPFTIVCTLILKSTGYWFRMEKN